MKIVGAGAAVQAGSNSDKTKWGIGV